MDGLRQYLIALTAAAIICAIAKSVADEKTLSGTVLRLIAGIVMTLTVLSPVVTLKLDALPALTTDIIDEARDAAAAGEEMAAAEVNSIISEQLRAYILDKAADLGASLEVEIQMRNDGSRLPEGIVLYGNVSPYAKSRLQNIIAEDIQIAKEKQQWIS